ncbi:hypothetical protein ACFPN0_04920 [Kitasatospora cinereorecta]
MDAYFRDWVRLLDRTLDLELEAALGNDDVRGFLWSAFENNGAMPPAYFVPLLIERRRALAQHAVDSLAATVHQQTVRPVTVPVQVNARRRTNRPARSGWATSPSTESTLPRSPSRPQRASSACWPTGTV